MANTPTEDLDLSPKLDVEETDEKEPKDPQDPTPEKPIAAEPGGADDEPSEEKPNGTNVASLVARKEHFKTQSQKWKERALRKGWKPEDDQPGDEKNPPTNPTLTSPQPITIPTTDDELTARFPSFPYMTPEEQTQLRGMVEIGKTVAEVKDLMPVLRQSAIDVRFSEAFTAITEEDTFEPLIDHREEFRAFYSKPENKGVSPRILAQSFMFEHGITERQKRRDDDAAADAERTLRTGVLPAQGGTKAAPKPQELTDAEQEAIRTSDPRKYREMVKKGIIR